MEEHHVRFPVPIVLLLDWIPPRPCWLSVKDWLSKAVSAVRTKDAMCSETSHCWINACPSFLESREFQRMLIASNRPGQSDCWMWCQQPSMYQEGDTPLYYYMTCRIHGRPPCAIPSYHWLFYCWIEYHHSLAGCQWKSDWLSKTVLAERKMPFAPKQTPLLDTRLSCPSFLESRAFPWMFIASGQEYPCPFWTWILGSQSDCWMWCQPACNKKETHRFTTIYGCTVGMIPWRACPNVVDWIWKNLTGKIVVSFNHGPGNTIDYQHSNNLWFSFRNTKSWWW